MTAGRARYAALLRGVNVGGNAKIAMSDLRSVLSRLGYDDVKTHLQSGNAVFTGPAGMVGNAPVMAAGIESALATQLGLKSRVLVRTGAELAAVVASNPFPSAEAEPSTHIVQFLFDPLPAGRPLTEADLRSFDISRFSPEDCRLGPGVLYFRHLPRVSESKLAVSFGKYLTATFPKAIRPEMTGRNWNTVRKLCDLTA